MLAAEGDAGLNHGDQVADGKVVDEVASDGFIGATENDVAIGKGTVGLGVSERNRHGDKFIHRAIGTTLEVLSGEVDLVPSHIPWARVDKAIEVVRLDAIHVDEDDATDPNPAHGFGGEGSDTAQTDDSDAELCDEVLSG